MKKLTTEQLQRFWNLLDTKTYPHEPKYGQRGGFDDLFDRIEVELKTRQR